MCAADAICCWGRFLLHGTYICFAESCCKLCLNLVNTNFGSGDLVEGRDNSQLASMYPHSSADEGSRIRI